jgi:hypothetical protein
VIWDVGVHEGLDAYNTANGTCYTITEWLFPIGRGKNPYDWWHIWLEHAAAIALMKDK